jgi:NitT/TauT family transport system substrate-binding protein
MKRAIAALLLAAIAAMPHAARAEVNELKVPLGAGGFGFLPLHMMQKHALIEKHAAAAGITLAVNWSNIGGPSVMNEALLSGSAHFISAGPPAFLTLWDRSKSTLAVKGIAAMSSMPMYLNTRAEHLRSIDDVKDGDKIAVTAVKVSIPSIIMQMHARAKYGPAAVFRFDPYTVSMTHPDAAVAILTGNTEVKAHYASQPFHQRERRDPAVRTIMNSNHVMGGDTTFTMISTTTKFHDENPKVCAAFVKALEEAIAMIASDKRAAAQVLLESLGGRGWTVDELAEMLADPEIKYTTVPENVMKYASFMHEIGTLKNRPAAISDLFFPEANVGAGH